MAHNLFLVAVSLCLSFCATLASPPRIGRYLHRIFERTCRNDLIQTTHMTVGSPRTHRAAHIEDRRRLPSPRVLGKPKKRGHASRFEPGTRQSLRRPSAASACPPLKLPAWERRAPATAIDICHLTPGTPQITPCASMGGAMKSQHGGRCKAVWSRLGVEALS